METKLREINVKLSKHQKEDIFAAFSSRRQVEQPKCDFIGGKPLLGKITLHLKNDALYGNDTLLVPEKSIKWDMYDQFVSDKETSPESFIGYVRNRISKYTFSEMIDNGFSLVPSINDEGLKNFRLYTPPTVVERLENARKYNSIGFDFILDYSLLNTSPNSIEYSVFKNVAKLMEDIPFSGM